MKLKTNKNCAKELRTGVEKTIYDKLRLDDEIKKKIQKGQ
jgi:hypothetical protein